LQKRSGAAIPGFLRYTVGGDKGQSTLMSADEKRTLSAGLRFRDDHVTSLCWR
jgi:hypothetical protein